MFSFRKEPGDLLCKQTLCLCLTGVSFCSRCAPAGICDWNPLSLLLIMVCSKALAAHQGNHPISHSFLGCCRCAGSTCKLPKQRLWGLEGSRLGTLPSLAPSTWLWGSHLCQGSRRVGIPHPPGKEGGRGSTTHLPPAFPVAPGNHSNTPCYGFGSGGLGCDRSQAQALPDISLYRVLLLPSLSLSSLAVSEPFPSPVFTCLLCFTGQITQGNGIDFAWAARKQIFFNFN